MDDELYNRLMKEIETEETGKKTKEKPKKKRWKVLRHKRQ